MQRVVAEPHDLRQMLIDFGVTELLAETAIPAMWFTPAGADPDSPSVIEVVKGLQRGLQDVGYMAVEVTGVLDEDTARALDAVSGPRGSWMQRPFFVVYADLARARRDPDRAARYADAMRAGVGSYFVYEGPPPGPLPGYKVGLPPGPMGLGDTATDQGVSLTFGRGIKDPEVMVPVPQKSGPTYQAFTDLQRAVNRVLTEVPGSRALSVDGLLGTGTYDALKKVYPRASLQWVGPAPIQLPTPKNTAAMAANAVSIAALLNAYADQRGIARGAKPGGTPRPAQTAETTGALTAEQVAALSRPPSTVGRYLPWLALAGGVAWLAAAQKKSAKKGRR